MVEVDEGGVFADGAEVGFGAVKTLHQVVPCMPFPDDVRTSRIIRRQFKDHV